MQKKSQLLLAEDDVYLADIYARHFSEQRCQIKVAKNFSEANKKIKKNLPDLIVVDIALEQKTGLAWIKELKSVPETKNIPIVVITSLGDRESIKAAGQAGVSHYFLKSQTVPRELAEKISELLRFAV